MVNPDGAEYDISGGKFHYWRKNRQPTPGIELDRHRPEPQLRLPLGRRRADQLEPGGDHLPRDRAPSRRPRPARCATSWPAASSTAGSRSGPRITFHEDGRLVMWPYGYTMTNVPADMTTQDHAALAAIGKHMAATNGYKPRAGERPVHQLRHDARLPVRRLPDLRVHLRDVGQGLPGRLDDRVRDRAEQGGGAVPAWSAPGARWPSWARPCARPAAAPSTTTSRSPAAGPSTRTAPTRRRPARRFARATRRRRRSHGPKQLGTDRVGRARRS